MATRSSRTGPSRVRVDLNTFVDVSGPFFEKDFLKTYYENVRAMLEGVAREGEVAVKAGIRPYNKSGLTEAGVVGRVRSLKGAEWHQTAIVSQLRAFPWAGHTSEEGAASNVMVGGFRAGAQYRGGKLEAKAHMFRRAATLMRKASAVNMAELTKGLN